VRVELGHGFAGADEEPAASAWRLIAWRVESGARLGGSLALPVCLCAPQRPLSRC